MENHAVAHAHSPAAPPPYWRRKLWWGAVALVFLAQIAVVFWLGDSQLAPVRPPTTPSTLRLAGPASAQLLALLDPTVLARPHPRGFSGPAWMTGPSMDFHPFIWSEPPNWLSLSIEQLGAAFRQFAATDLASPLPHLAQPWPELILPQIQPINTFPENSGLLLTGDLARRNLLKPIPLRSWQHTDYLTNTVVEVMVDGEGQPIAATLLRSSGLRDADTNALAQALSARFAPRNSADTMNGASALDGLSWGQMIFAWHTLPMTATNGPAAPPQ